MVDRNILFEQQRAANGNLTFGENYPPTHMTGYLSVTFPAFAVSIKAIPNNPATLAAAFPAFAVAATAEYNSRAERPTVAKAASDWDIAAPTEVGVAEDFETPNATLASEAVVWGSAAPRIGQVQTVIPSSLTPAKVSASITHQNAAHTSAGDRLFATTDALRNARRRLESIFQGGQQVKAYRESGQQVAARGARLWHTANYTGARRYEFGFTRKFSAAAYRRQGWVQSEQNAWTPRPGHYTKPVTPPVVDSGCYVRNGNLVFKTLADHNSDLVFICDNWQAPEQPSTVVIPVKRAYIVVNNINIRRASDNTELPCYGLSMNIDADSWTWAFNATFHSSALPYLEPSVFGQPVELVVSVNGTSYRMLAENISSERQFGSKRISVNGRGKSAVLADPYSPIFTFKNIESRTAQQLMNDALMDNGVSIGWTVDFGLEDWTVPAGVWSHSGTYMSAIKAIAEAAGGYVQPDPVSNTLYVKPRYPVAPWDFNTLTADYSLPAAVTSREGISWLDKANYNGVYVSGTSDGVSAWVRKEGTAGDYLAPMVVDPLITDVIPARQRGTSILGYTGRMATVTLSLPILSETGIILPGTIIDYVDGDVTRRGITRSVSLATNLPSIRQSIEVETHVY